MFAFFGSSALYCPGPGISFALMMLHSTSDLGVYLPHVPVVCSGKKGRQEQHQHQHQQTHQKKEKKSQEKEHQLCNTYTCECNLPPTTALLGS